jgi:hypothetical protein
VGARDDHRVLVAVWLYPGAGGQRCGPGGASCGVLRGIAGLPVDVVPAPARAAALTTAGGWSANRLGALELHAVEVTVLLQCGQVGRLAGPGPLIGGGHWAPSWRFAASSSIAATSTPLKQREGVFPRPPLPGRGHCAGSASRTETAPASW